MRLPLRHRPLLGLLLALLLFDGILMLWAAWALTPPGSGAEVLIRIPKGVSSAAITDTLSARGVLRGTRLFRLAVFLGGDEDLRAGRYLFRVPEAPSRVLTKLKRGETEKVWLRVPEGLWLTETLDLVARQLDLDSLDLARAAARHRRGLPEYLEARPDLEGFLFPDSYAFEDPVEAGEVIPRMVARCLQVLDQLQGRYDLGAKGLSPLEWVTLASIVEAECSRDEERERIAAVYLNRLRLGMRLEADPTVIYAHGERKQRLYYKHLNLDSPYNTYRRKGLPPGPICSPGRESLEAVLAAGDSLADLYFVARGDGGHFFSRSFEEHLEKVDAIRNGRTPKDE